MNKYLFNYEIAEGAGILKKVVLNEEYVSGTSDEKTIVIPSEIDGIKIRKIKSNVMEGVFAKRVIISEGIRIIEDNAFLGNEIEEVKLPTSLVRIGNYAFDSNAIKSIVIPPNVISIGMFAFGEVEEVFNFSSCDFELDRFVRAEHEQLIEIYNYNSLSSLSINSSKLKANNDVGRSLQKFRVSYFYDSKSNDVLLVESFKNDVRLKTTVDKKWSSASKNEEIFIKSGKNEFLRYNQDSNQLFHVYDDGFMAVEIEAKYNHCKVIDIEMINNEEVVVKKENTEPIPKIKDEKVMVDGELDESLEMFLGNFYDERPPTEEEMAEFQEKSMEELLEYDFEIDEATIPVDEIFENDIEPIISHEMIGLQVTLPTKEEEISQKLSSKVRKIMNYRGKKTAEKRKINMILSKVEREEGMDLVKGIFRDFSKILKSK